MMIFREGDLTPQELGIEKPKKLTRTEVEIRITNDESLEGLILTDLDLAGLELEGKSLRGADIRGITLYRKAKREGERVVEDETRTNIRNSDWTDATIADFGEGAFFGRVDAEGAIFGYTERLDSRRERLEKSGKNPTAEDSGGLFGFDGREGSFKRTRWVNIDFGGGSDYESIFSGADLSASIIEGSDLTGIDFSTVKIDGIKIKNLISLNGMKISERQIPVLVQAIELSDEKDQSEFLEEVQRIGQREVLERYFGVVIVEVENE